MKTPIFVDEQVLHCIDDRLTNSTADFRVFVLHHHILPFIDPALGDVRDNLTKYESPDATIVANSAKLQAWLTNRGFHLVLHGHKHHFHGREDRLGSAELSGRQVLVVGAGSAGVNSSHRGSEPLGYNVIEAHRGTGRRWRVDVDARKVQDPGVHEASVHATWSAEAGALSGDEPAAFTADYSDDCHALIKRATRSASTVENFISTIRRADYRHPPTTTIGNKHQTEEEVHRSFLALHPEWEPSKHWTDRTKLPASLHERSPRVQFLHGPRLFSVPAAGPQTEPVKDEHRPIVKALSRLSQGPSSNAYVSHRPEIDVLAAGLEPLPALLSLQFIRRGDTLDLVATFRKLELSFWWVVNVYEAIEILEWALSVAKCKTAGRITFFAPLAEWQENPERTVVSSIDQLALTNAVILANRVAQKHLAAIHELKQFLIEKRAETNEKNVVASGVLQLSRILGGLLVAAPSSESRLRDLHSHLNRASDHLQQGLTPREGDSSALQLVDVALGDAIETLDGLALESV